MRIESSLLWSAMVLLLASCGGDAVAPQEPTPDPGAETPDAGLAPDGDGDGDGDASAPTASRLAGVWSVERGITSAFGTSGPMTIEFPSESSGKARFLGRDAPSGITLCADYMFATFDDVVVLDSPSFVKGAFLIAQPDDDTITLTSDTEHLTLSRLSGARPVEECGTAEVSVAVSSAEWGDVEPLGIPSLVAVDDVLYFNTNDSQRPIVGYSLSTKTFGPPRTYTVSSGGGIDRVIVAAADHDVFYGHCWCGSSDRLSQFNLANDVRVIGINTNDLADPVQIRYGARHAGNLIVGGRSGVTTENRLLTLDPSTLALRSARSVLSGAFLSGIAYYEDKLHALVAGRIVEIGADGRATKTYDSPELRTPYLRTIGLTSVGGKLYTIGIRDDDDSVVLFEITLK